jgi:hypothetical protein
MSDKTTMPCPACREIGKDTDGDNLSVFPSGKFHCIAAGKDKTHNRRIIELMPELGKAKASPVQRPHATTPRPPETPFAWPELERGTASDFRQLTRLRDVDADGLKILSSRGLLRFANFDEERAWLAVDPSLKNAQARLLSGEKWHGIDCMSRSPNRDSGAVHGWPIGITAAASFSAIALVEGMPDFISVLHHAGCHGLESLIAPVMIPGAGVRIVEDALPLFAGKRVRVFVHNDGGAGASAFALWSGQLCGAGAVVDGFSFDGLVQSNGEPVKDLNDLCRIGADSWETHHDAVESVMMNFATEGVLCPE